LTQYNHIAITLVIMTSGHEKQKMYFCKINLILFFI